MKGKILITPRSLTVEGHPAFYDLAAADYEVVFSTPGKMPDEEELIRLVPGCVGYLAGVEKVTAAVLHAATSLRAISRNGVGIDNIDLDAAERLGIAVCKAVGANARGVAELTLGLILAVARSIPANDRVLKAGDWSRRKGFEIEGKTLGVVGCGRIGRLVAQMSLALGMEVVAYDVVPDEAFAPGAAFRFASLDALIEESDVVSLHCPPPIDGSPVLDKDTLARMKPGAIVVNTARHDLVDVDALIERLDAGALAGAALDVFDGEPPTDRAAIEHERIVATAHVGGFTNESVDRAVRMAVDNLLEALREA